MRLWSCAPFFLLLAGGHQLDACYPGPVVYAGSWNEFLLPREYANCQNVFVEFLNAHQQQRLMVWKDHEACADYLLIDFFLPHNAPLGLGRISWSCGGCEVSYCQSVVLKAAKQPPQNSCWTPEMKQRCLSDIKKAEIYGEGLETARAGSELTETRCTCPYQSPFPDPSISVHPMQTITTDDYDTVTWPTDSVSTQQQVSIVTSQQIESSIAHGGGSPSSSSYRDAVMTHHNMHRSNHSAPNLEWDETLALYAARTAQTCVFAHDLDQGNDDYGQNLASWGGTGDIDGLKIRSAITGITNAWYNGEMSHWSFYGQENLPEDMSIANYGHFTQLVWKSSTSVGCSSSLCAAGTIFPYPTWYTVCNYQPQGNIAGQYGQNVLAPLGQRAVFV